MDDILLIKTRRLVFDLKKGAKMCYQKCQNYSFVASQAVEFRLAQRYRFYTNKMRFEDVQFLTGFEASYY